MTFGDVCGVGGSFRRFGMDAGIDFKLHDQREAEPAAMPP